MLALSILGARAAGSWGGGGSRHLLFPCKDVAAPAERSAPSMAMLQSFGPARCCTEGLKMLYLSIEPVILPLLYRAGRPIAKHHARCFPEPQSSHVILLVFGSPVRVEIVSGHSGWRYALSRAPQFRACWRKGAGCFV